MEKADLFNTIKTYNPILFFSCLVLILINLIFYGFFISPRQKKIYMLQKQYIEKRNFEKPDKISKTSQYANALKALNGFKKKLFPASSFPNSIDELNRIFSRHGLSMGQLLFKASKIENLALSKYSTSFTVTGNYMGLKGLLADLQSHPRLFCIEKLAFEKGSNGQINMEISLALYFN